MGFRKRKNIELYDSIEDISIYNFDKVINGDLRYLAKTDNISKVKISDAYKNAWSKIYNEYASKSKNNEIVRIYFLLAEINYLRLRVQIVPKLIDVLLSAVDLDIFKLEVDEIENLRLSFNKENPLKEEVIKIQKVLKNSITKLKRKQHDYNELTKEKEAKQTIYQQKITLERGLGISIDIKNDSIAYWLSCWDELKKVIEHKKKNKLANV